ncbi:MAG: sulfur carrier protein ThiS, partial [Pedobacter sp.]
IQDPCNVQELLTHVLQKTTHGIAVAVNENIISKAQWPSHNLISGDQIIIIKATQGG